MRLSKLTESDVMEYLRTDEHEGISLMLSAAKSFALQYTGLSAFEADKYEDMCVAVLTICGEMYDNRVYTVESDAVNPIAKGILEMHCRNFI